MNTNRDFFKMGAAVAVGELYDAGRLGSGAEAAACAREFLSSFGLGSLQEIRDLGLTGPYLEDFEGLYA